MIWARRVSEGRMLPSLARRAETVPPTTHDPGVPAMRRALTIGIALGASVSLLGTAPLPAQAERLPVADGYRGIWYFNQPSGDEYKYSGGFATYPQQHVPIAWYSK